MMRFQYPHPLLRYEGYSPLTAMRLHLDEIEGIDRSRWYAMNRGIHPSAVLNFDEAEGMAPLPEAEIERIKAEFESSHQGPENFGQLFVSTPGARLDPWGMNPVDMDYTAGWDQLCSFAMGGFGITKPAAGMIEDTSYSVLFATLKQLHLLTLDPDISDVASEFTRKVAPFFGDDLIVEMRCRRIDDHDVKRANMQFLQGALAITKNEARKAMDMDVTDEPWGEEIAGMPSQPEGGGLEQLLGAMGGEGMGGAEEGMEEGVEEDEEKNMLMPEEDPGEKGVEGSRPRPGNLGRGALGPRKSLVNTKDLRKKYRKKPAPVQLKRQAAVLNGSH